MEANIKESKARADFLHSLIQRLPTPWIIILIMLAFLGGTVFAIFAIRYGATFSCFGAKIEGAAQDTTNPSNAETKGQAELLNSNVSAYELSLSFKKHFDPNFSKEELTTKIGELVEGSDELEKLKKNISFKLLELEIKIIPQYGNGKYFDTRSNDGSNETKEACKRIQAVLKDIGAYDGPVDGNQQLTCNALKEFQASRNKAEGRDVFPPGDFGIFGNATLAAIRSAVKAKEQTL